jgi:hypothetical protein
MSYTEYMNRKKAAAPVILDVRPKMDASTFTRHQRVTASANVYAPTKSVVGNINEMRTSMGRDNKSVKAGVQVTVSTGQGGRVPDGSTFSDYKAGVAAEMDYKNGPIIGRVTMNVSGGLTGCIVIPEPTPAKVAKSASQLTRDRLDCYQKQGEPHNDPRVPGVMPPLFVDHTISVNGVFGIGMGKAGAPKTASGASIPQHQCPRVHHTHPAPTPIALWAPRPTKGAGGLFAYPVRAPQEHQFKVGAAIARPKYVESHHGNDFNVNPRRVPTPFQIPAGAPAHLKINDPKRTV